MFSSLVPRSIPLFGFGRSAGAGEAIKISAVPVHDIETSTDKRARRLKHLLKLNHTNHAILFHYLQFHNHTPHHLGSAYLLNGSADHLNAIYEDAKDLDPWVDSPGEIALHDWRDFLGKREYQRAFVDFFEDQLVHCGYDWKEVIAEFALKGPDPMINCFVSGLGHPLIHLGYAYELNSKEVAMEALGLAATCYNDLHKYLDEEKWSKMPTKYQTSNPLEVLARVNADDRLKSTFDHIGNNNLSKVFDEYEHVLVEHWNSWKITDPVKQFEQSQQLAVALLISTASSIGGHGYDFFLVHLLTTSHAVRILIPFLPPKFHIPLVRQWWLITVAIYIAQTRPVIKLDYISEVDVGSKDWDWVDKQALEGRRALDAHFVKAVRAMQEAGNVWGDKDDFYLKAAVKFAMEFDGWGGFHEDDPEAQEVQREKR